MGIELFTTLTLKTGLFGEPDFSDGEKYWHYGENGGILIWGEDTKDAAAQSI